MKEEPKIAPDLYLNGIPAADPQAAMLARRIAAAYAEILRLLNVVLRAFLEQIRQHEAAPAQSKSR